MTALDLAKDWLRFAKSDITTAIHMFENVHPKETEISCYHSQQCAIDSAVGTRGFRVARSGH